MCDMDKYEKVAVALLFAILIVWVWRSIPNSPKVYPWGRRLHHGLIGAVYTGSSGTAVQEVVHNGIWRDPGSG